MGRRKNSNEPSGLNPAKKWLAGVLAVLTLGVVVALDYLSGEGLTFTLLYLAPVAIAVWFVDSRLALVLAFLAAGSGLAIQLIDRITVPTALWNVGVRLGVYLVFYALLSYLRQHASSNMISPLTRKWIAIGALVPCLTLIAAGVAKYQAPNHLVPPGEYSTTQMAGAREEGLIAELASSVSQSMKLGRPLLLGSRDPNGASCVQVSRAGDVKGVMPENPGDLDGGPGTSMAVLYFFDRRDFKSPLQDFKWHQTRFRTYLENNVARGLDAEQTAHDCAERTSAFSQAADDWSTVPEDLKAAGFNQREDWPNYCLSELDKAVAARHVSDVQHWSRELAAAMFWLEDLLRWRRFLYENYLAALDFQAQCESLFVSAEQEHLDYKPESTMSQFPAGILGLNSKGNFYEVERQAERLYSMPAERLDEIAENRHLTTNSVWMPPASRQAFLQLRAVLSPENQKTWDLAARTPYQHGYLTNLLFRARTADLVDDLATVLKKVDARNPHATVSELMGPMMYRGHSFGGIEWGDRFQPQLTEAAAKITESLSDLDALKAAWEWTNKFYKTPAEYGVTFTLRDALEQKKLDCVRATDMIAAIFRNAGRTHLGHVRWCSETGGHSVAAYMGLVEVQGKPLLVDGLTAPHEPETWPDCYFHGHAWPPGLEDNKPPYAMELYVRGIDSYVWLQGYIVRGPNAGRLSTAAIPYSRHFQTGADQKVFDGPYPQ